MSRNNNLISLFVLLLIFIIIFIIKYLELFSINVVNSLLWLIGFVFFSALGNFIFNKK